MKTIFKYVLFINLISFLFFGCPLKYGKKWLNFYNGRYITEIIFVDINNEQNKYIIEHGYLYGWSEKVIGDFKFIYIKSENDLEGIFVINNEYKDKGCDYPVDIKIVEDIFELEYDESNLNIVAYFNYDENYLEMREKYFSEYNLKL
jgi:hypothetical protein